MAGKLELAAFSRYLASWAERPTPSATVAIAPRGLRGDIPDPVGQTVGLDVVIVHAVARMRMVLDPLEDAFGRIRAERHVHVVLDLREPRVVERKQLPELGDVSAVACFFVPGDDVPEGSFWRHVSASTMAAGEMRTIL